MRRKDQTKNLIILKKKIISDNALSFLYLINKINYKRLTSSTKRSLLPHYVIYKFFLTSLKINFRKQWYRSFTQYNNQALIMLPSLFAEKRMFLKTSRLLSFYGNNINNSYGWYNQSTINILKKNSHFSKILMLPAMGGQHIMSAPLQNFSDIDLNNILFKDILLKKNVDFNIFIFFNISLLNMLEIYKVIILLWVYKVIK